MLPKLKVPFLCTGNSCRSQMAKGLLRRCGGARFEVYSAVLQASEIHSLAARVMEACGILLTGQRSKRAREHLGKLVVHHLAVVCARAERECRKRCREAARQDSWPFADALAFDGPREKRFEAFREARDGIERRILGWLRDPDLGLVGGRT